MRGRHEDGPLQVRRAWVWAADAECRWRRAVRLLLQDAVAARALAAQQEGDHDEHGGGGLHARLDRAAGRSADQ